MLAAVGLEGKSGFIDKDGRFFIYLKFDGAKSFSEGLARVRLGNKFGFIDRTGRFAIEPQFDHNLEIMNFSEGLAATEIEEGNDTRFGFIDKTGASVVDLHSEWDSTHTFEFKEGLAAVKCDGKWGYVDTSGTVLIEPHFRLAASFSENLAQVWLFDRDGYQLIDKNGSLIGGEQSEFEFVGESCNGIFPAARWGLWGYIDRDGKRVIKPQFSFASGFYEGMAAVRQGDKDEWGYIDESGHYVINPRYSQAFLFHNGRAVVEMNHMSGIIGNDGTFIVEPQFDQITVWPDGPAMVRLEDKYNFVNESGKLLAAQWFDDARDFSEGLAAVKVGGIGPNRWGFINAVGDVAIEPQFERAQEFVKVP